MFRITYATEQDIPFWFSLDKHIQQSELIRKIRDQRALIIQDDDTPIGIMRYNLFWDSVPFVTLIIFEESWRQRGYGRQAMVYWEDAMRVLGHGLVMTSTNVDESAQHFYRKLGYVDCGCLVMNMVPYTQNMEMFLIKQLC